MRLISHISFLARCFLLISGLFLFLSTQLQAQRYGTTIGARWGGARYGVSLQQRIEGNSTVEAMALFGGGETTLGALYEYHKPIIFKWKGFNTYIGAGAHIGWYRTDTLNANFWGFAGIMGIEYKLPLMPFAGSLDFKPTYNLSHPNEKRHFQPQFAVSVRYILVTYREQEKRKRQRERERQKNKDDDKKGGIFDIFDKNDKDKEDKKKDDKPQKDKKDSNSISGKKEEEKPKKDAKNTPKDDKQPKESESFWDKINIFKKKDDN